ncbi:HelD family protein [Nocardioides massiliensis]|uniref:DNA helicase IV n=1 Tax=Nocardioides massiliensis TaxID=1325935 RepID=A0ABT9NLY7_9ACTN|nr:UvrD-helicase domain-containing protein [Nocardioides massiliensis]MDP9821434.1 DNA helicase IV [Nocardioides massiliensis]
MTEQNQGDEDLYAREVAAEQRFVDRVQTRLEAAARSAQELAQEGHNRARLGHEGGLVERDAMVFQAAKRLATLDAAHEGLVFGRLDLDPELDPEPRYIGRLGLRDEARDTLLIDWRAPAASVFYQATAATPQGVVRRRVLRSTGTTVIGVEDELLDDSVETDLPILGEGALMAQLSRARDRSMHSIVATIQAEQDEAIRAPLKGVVTISGGPGTGKTVVALHRAAYLLFTDRRRYETGGVLIVGPSGVFMRYIERVLPSLGETAVALRSLGEVVDGLRAERRDEPAVADVKGSARMAELMRRLARQAVPGAPRHFRMFYRDDVLQLSGKELGAVRRQLLSKGRRNRQINQVPRALADALWRQVRSERGRERGYGEFVDDLLSDDAFVEFALAWWPAVDGPTVLGWLRDPEVRARVAEGILSADEQALLTKSWSEVRATHWSVEDVALIDELRYAVGDLPTVVEHGERSLIGTRGDEDEAPTREEVTTVSDRELAGRPGWSPPQHKIEDDGYAHVLIDEAQDLTPMQWRMVGRRGRRATWTIVGDPAQSSWPEPREAQAARDAALEGKPIHAFHLSKNYRNSSEIYEFAAAYADRVGLDADLPEAVRSTGVHPEERTVDDLADGVRAAVGELAAEVAGTVGIVVPHARRRQVQEWLESWPEHADDAAGGANARIPVLVGLETKGLEFDAIVVVEPDEIETESSTGRATLYVVYTRATQRMVAVREG